MHHFELNRTVPPEIDIIICQNVSHKVTTSFYFRGDQFRLSPTWWKSSTCSRGNWEMAGTVSVNSSISVYFNLYVWQIKPKDLGSIVKFEKVCKLKHSFEGKVKTLTDQS